MSCQNFRQVVLSANEECWITILPFSFCSLKNYFSYVILFCNSRWKLKVDVMYRCNIQGTQDHPGSMQQAFPRPVWSCATVPKCTCHPGWHFICQHVRPARIHVQGRGPRKTWKPFQLSKSRWMSTGTLINKILQLTYVYNTCLIFNGSHLFLDRLWQWWHKLIMLSCSRSAMRILILFISILLIRRAQAAFKVFFSPI